MKLCEVCGKKSSTKNKNKFGNYLCVKHYSQMDRHGKILNRTRFTPNEYILYEDYAEIICYDKNNEEVGRTKINLEDVDRCKEYKWVISGGYVENKSSRVKLHNFLLGKKMIDHINRDKLDNRLLNLRYCTHQENCYNKSKRSNNTSGVIGVSFRKKRNVWKAEIGYDKTYIYLGQSKDMKEVIKLRLIAERDFFGEFAPQIHLFEEYGVDVND